MHSSKALNDFPLQALPADFPEIITQGLFRAFEEAQTDAPGLSQQGIKPMALLWSNPV